MIRKTITLNHYSKSLNRSFSRIEVSFKQKPPEKTLTKIIQVCNIKPTPIAQLIVSEAL